MLTFQSWSTSPTHRINLFVHSRKTGEEMVDKLTIVNSFLTK